jgi:hypothetical protein
LQTYIPLANSPYRWANSRYAVHCFAPFLPALLCIYLNIFSPPCLVCNSALRFRMYQLDSKVFQIEEISDENFPEAGSVSRTRASRRLYRCTSNRTAAPRIGRGILGLRGRRRRSRWKLGRDIEHKRLDDSFSRFHSKVQLLAGPV